jgi:hypothetical protein
LRKTAGRELNASSRRSSEMVSNWGGLCAAEDCSGLMMMMMNYNLMKINVISTVFSVMLRLMASTNYGPHTENGHKAMTDYTERFSLSLIKINVGEIFNVRPENIFLRNIWGLIKVHLSS